GVHVATANDYLAARDALWTAPLFARLGLTVASITQEADRATRVAAYRSDVTYTTARELGFDFLRDRLAQRAMRERKLLYDARDPLESSGTVEPVQRGLHCAIVDEADSLLIDEARVPLVISATSPAAQQEIATFHWATAAARELRFPEHFSHDAREHRVELTAAGRAKARELASADVARLTSDQIYDALERAVRVERELIRDRHYVVRDDQIVIVDEFTGRLAEGRQWRGGLHQAVESREGLKVTPPTSPAARITVQEFFTRYKNLAGMTGTALSAASEFRVFFQRPVASIPTHRPCVRRVEPTCVFVSQHAKAQAILAETRELTRWAGRFLLAPDRSTSRNNSQSCFVPRDWLTRCCTPDGWPRRRTWWDARGTLGG
ncbi:MAG: preprotein translocase subunit SecA, partial [Planctomycetota bacterium]|nr:preprotein translocase subunit SecA [Planctomycetota bacterium]